MVLTKKKKGGPGGEQHKQSKVTRVETNLATVLLAPWERKQAGDGEKIPAMPGAHYEHPARLRYSATKGWGSITLS